MRNQGWGWLLMIPLTGIIVSYVFIFCALSKFGNLEIYNVDPRDAFKSNFYNVSYYMHISGIIILFLLGIIFFGALIFKRELFFSKKATILYFGLVIIYILMHKVDIGNYLNWFFD
jgi:hypothetical protein